MYYTFCRPGIRCGTVALAWATEKEVNFDYFQIERASVDFQFHPIGSLPGAGYEIHSRRDYLFIDERPLAGTSYYRLKAVDLDGTFEYFHVVSVINEVQPSVQVYPNPVTDNILRLDINFNPSPNDKVVISAINGRAQAQFNVVKEGLNEYQLDGLEPGLYILQYISPGFQKVLRLLIQ